MTIIAIVLAASGLTRSICLRRGSRKRAPSHLIWWRVASDLLKTRRWGWSMTGTSLSLHLGSKRLLEPIVGEVTLWWPWCWAGGFRGSEENEGCSRSSQHEFCTLRPSPRGRTVVLELLRVQIWALRPTTESPSGQLGTEGENVLQRHPWALDMPWHWSQRKESQFIIMCSVPTNHPSKLDLNVTFLHPPVPLRSAVSEKSPGRVLVCLFLPSPWLWTLQEGSQGKGE